MHKHSLSFPWIPASAPTSPATTRLNKSERDHVSPITPQRLICSTKKMSRSPLTPGSTPSLYTPPSLRSLTNSSSVLTTPGSFTSPERFSVAYSCENAISSKTINKNISGATANWHFRANENGIKTIANTGFSPDEDEASDIAPSDANSFSFVHEEALLPSPFLSHHRRSRTQSNNFPFSTCSPVSPQERGTSMRRTLGVLNTPPPKLTNNSQPKYKGSFTDPPHRRRPSFGQMSAHLFDENAFEPYPQSFSTTSQPLVLQDPFRGPILSPVSESVPQRFPVSTPEIAISGSVKPQSSSCVICDRADGTLLKVEPCNHEHCNACFTSALNIVGEKPMECARCNTPIINFTFNPVLHETCPSRTDYPSSPYPFQPQASPLNPMSFISGLFPQDSPFCSQPNDNVVLRIDNVPWDITPLAIAAWLKHPIVRGHVLLDEKGKTLSHAYVELATEEIAKAALQSVQNTVLGKGTRARGVTVTRSSQEELMRALFPSWKGTFDGSRPSFTGLQPEHYVFALTSGLMTMTELDPLMGLISSPSRFLKVPSLPFYFLISILSKFSSDINGRALWSKELAGKLFVITSRALDVLVALLRENGQQDDPDLLGKLLEAGVSCQAFTPQQIETLKSIEIACNNALAATFHTSQNWRFPNVMPSKSELYGGLAREYGVDEKLVEELVHRLTGEPPLASGSQLQYCTLD